MTDVNAKLPPIANALLGMLSAFAKSGCIKYILIASD